MQNIQQQRVSGNPDEVTKKRPFSEFSKGVTANGGLVAPQEHSARKQRKPTQPQKVETLITSGSLSSAGRKPATLKHSKLTFADLRKRKTTTSTGQMVTPSIEEIIQTPSEVPASGFSLASSTQQLGQTQICDQTQMDVDQQGESATVQALTNRTSKLDAIKDLDAQLLKKTAERDRHDKEQRIQERYKRCETLPEDWALKTELEIQMPLLKPVDDINEILNYKEVARSLSYFIYTETQLPKFLQENQNAEYLRNSDKISWVKSFKDVYQKFVSSYMCAQNCSELSDEVVSELDMPCFYLRNQATIALFKIDPQTAQPVAELVPSLALARLIKERSGNLNYSVQNIYEEEDEVESETISGKKFGTNGKGDNAKQSKDESDDPLDLDDLMDEMQDTINIAEKQNLKLSSMHHFKLKPRDVVQVFRFSGQQSCHALYMLLLNYMCTMNEQRKRSREGPQTQIIAPRPFMDCLYKECNMTYKGVVETKSRVRSSTNTSVEKTSSYFNLKFNGIIFPQPIRRICKLSKAVLEQQASNTESVSISLVSDTNSHPFSHKQLVGQIVINRDDAYQVRID